jgi:hypothetical protein
MQLRILDQKIKEVRLWESWACQQIDECPYICKKMNFIWRLAGGKMPEADYMKATINERAIELIQEIQKGQTKK